MFDEDFERFGPFGGAGRLRAARGMMEPAILRTLLDKPMHGYEIISSIEERSHGMWRPSAGSVYPTLQLLEEKEFVTSATESGKKVYSLTDTGREAAEATRPEYVEAWRRRFSNEDKWQGRRMNMRHEYQHQFHRQAGEIFKLMRQIFRKGGVSQKAAMELALDDFKTKLEHILKENQ